MFTEITLTNMFAKNDFVCARAACENMCLAEIGGEWLSAHLSPEYHARQAWLYQTSLGSQELDKTNKV